MHGPTRVTRLWHAGAGLLAVCALLLGMTPAAPANAGGPPDTVSGTFSATSAMPASMREAGGNCFVEVPGDVFHLDGDLEGDLTLDFRLHFHNPCAAIYPIASAEFHATATFTGSAMVGGTQRSGSFDVAFNGRIDAQGIARGHAAIRHGSGDFEGLRGVLEFEGEPGVGGDYAGRVSG
jgi:hypothetical protein